MKMARAKALAFYWACVPERESLGRWHRIYTGAQRTSDSFLTDTWPTSPPVVLVPKHISQLPSTNRCHFLSMPTMQLSVTRTVLDIC